MHKGKKGSLREFLAALFNRYIMYAFCCTSNRAVTDIVAYVRNLMRKRAKEFIQAYKPKDEAIKEKIIKQYENRMAKSYCQALCSPQ